MKTEISTQTMNKQYLHIKTRRFIEPQNLQKEIYDPYSLVYKAKSKDFILVDTKIIQL